MEKFMRMVVLAGASVLIYGLLAYGVLRLRANNDCMKYGIPNAVFSIPGGTSCVVTLDGTTFAIPLSKITENMKIRIY